MREQQANVPRQDHRVTVAMPRNLVERLQQQADRESNHLSSVVRRLLTVGLQRESRDAHLDG